MKFYRCACCDCYHPCWWDGDCRDDEHRFTPDQLDEKYGPFGWEDVEVYDA